MLAPATPCGRGRTGPEMLLVAGARRRRHPGGTLAVPGCPSESGGWASRFRSCLAYLSSCLYPWRRLGGCDSFLDLMFAVCVDCLASIHLPGLSFDLKCCRSGAHFSGVSPGCLTHTWVWLYKSLSSWERLCASPGSMLSPSAPWMITSPNRAGLSWMAHSHLRLLGLTAAPVL